MSEGGIDLHQIPPCCESVPCCAVLGVALLKPTTTLSCSPDYMIGTPGVPGACQKTCDMCDSAGDKGDGSEEVPDANDECRDLNENCE